MAGEMLNKGYPMPEEINEKSIRYTHEKVKALEAYAREHFEG